MKINEKKKLNPSKLWCDTFVSDGKFSISFNKKGNFSSHCEVVKSFSTIKAFYDDKGNLHLVLKEER
jgi:hypothetical protein